jgi:hypothetical protein
MLTEVLGSMIIAGEKLGKLWRWICKAWKVNLATQAAFAKLDIIHRRLAKTLIPPMQSTTGRAGNIHSTQI